VDKYDISDYDNKLYYSLSAKSQAFEYGYMNIRMMAIGLTLLMLSSSGAAVSADFQKGINAYELGDFETAIEEWGPLAELGNPLAQHNIGFMYNSGKGVVQNSKTALKWFILSAEQGHAEAQYNVGIFYDAGTGVKENDKTAIHWYTLSAEQGNAEAQNSLGRMYNFGNGIPEQNKVAVEWYIKAAKQGHALSQFDLGVMYANGEGVLTDNLRAYMWWNLGAYNGNSKSAEYKNIIASEISSAQLLNAQEMSLKCLNSGYVEC